MFNQIIQFSRSNRYDVALKIFISVLFLCLVGPIRFNIQSEVPITLQSLAVLLVAIWFGWRIGVSAILIYIFLGAMGAPVFAGYEFGINKLTGNTSGFFLGFTISAFVCGLFAHKPAYRNWYFNLNLWFIGHAIILFSGAAVLSFYTDDVLSIIKPLSIGLFIKSFTGWALTMILFQFLKKKKVTK